MPKFTARQAQDALVTAAFVAGLAAVAAGVALVYMPAGVIVAGVSAVASAVLYERGTRRR